MALTIQEQQLQKFFEVLASSKLPSELVELVDAPTETYFLPIQAGTADAKKIKVPILRGMLGTYNAGANTPALSNGTAVNGDKYVVSLAGTVDFGDGSVSLEVNDIIEYIDEKWHVYETRNMRGKANGYTPLNALGKIPKEYLPDDIVHSLSNNYIEYFHAAYDSGLTFNVTATWVFRGEVFETGLPVPVTLNNGDPSNPRIDVIAVNDQGNIVVIEGTPDANPAKPELDPSTQLEGTFVIIDTNGTTPDGVTTDYIYNENTGTGGGEYTATENTGGARVNLGATTDPYVGTVHTIFTVAQKFDRMNLTAPAAVPIADVTQTSFRIKNITQAPVGALELVILGQQSNGNSKNITIAITDVHGFDRTLTGSYQYINVPIPSNTNIANIIGWRLVSLAVASNNYTFYVDAVKFIGGTAPGVEEGVTKDYVDYRDEVMLQAAKDYADSLSFGGGDKHYTHVQSTPSTTWTCNHNLNKKPSVQVHDSSGNRVDGHEEHSTLNQTILTFDAAFSGEATFN